MALPDPLITTKPSANTPVVPIRATDEPAGELALQELKKEREARIAFDERVSVLVDDLGEQNKTLSVQVDGLHSLTSRFQLQLTNLEENNKKLAPMVAKIANFRWWLAGIIAVVEVLRESGLGAAASKALELIGGQ